MPPKCYFQQKTKSQACFLLDDTNWQGLGEDLRRKLCLTESRVERYTQFEDTISFSGDVRTVLPLPIVWGEETRDLFEVQGTMPRRVTCPQAAERATPAHNSECMLGAKECTVCLGPRNERYVRE